MEFPRQDTVISHLIEWSGQRLDVRAAILTSSRAGSVAPVDLLSDYDVIFAVEDVHPYFDSRKWLEDFGSVLVLWRDPIRLEYGLERFAYITQYESGLKIDFTLMAKGILAQVAKKATLPDELDVGYQVLLDKDGLTAGLKPPTHRAHIPAPPTEPEYLYQIETFFHELTYVAKYLCRDELMPARAIFEEAKVDHLRRLLEWRIEIECGWTFKPGVYGRFLKSKLDNETWQELEATCAGPGIEESWNALFAAARLFRRIAIEAGQALSYPYPDEMDRRMAVYLSEMRALRLPGTE